MDSKSIRAWALESGMNPRTAERAVKKLGVGCKICNGRVILLSEKDWQKVLDHFA